MGHCLDYSLMNQISANAWLYPNYFTNDELRKIYNGEDRYSISKVLDFKRLVKKIQGFNLKMSFLQKNPLGMVQEINRKIGQKLLVWLHFMKVIMLTWQYLRIII